MLLNLSCFVRLSIFNIAACTDSQPAYLRLHGVKARDHPVFIELTRVKQYFDKIKKAENPEDFKPAVTLDKGAAKRFIAAGLSGNDKYDATRDAQKKRPAAQGPDLKPETQKSKSDKAAKHTIVTEKKATPLQTKSSESDTPSSNSEDSEDLEDESEAVAPAPKRQKAEQEMSIPTGARADAGKVSEGAKQRRKSQKKRKKTKKSATA